MTELNNLLTFLHSPATTKDAIKARVNQKLAAYQNSVELMYDNSVQMDAGLLKESPVLGRVPDPNHNNVPRLAIVQATKHDEPGESKLTTWSWLSFVDDSLDPEAYAAMGTTHPGQQILDFKLLRKGNVRLGLAPAG
jgi:hypothetical protein